MALMGGCHCGAIRYEVSGDALHIALCHCTDCRRATGAPVVAWMMVRDKNLTVTSGAPREYASSADGRRYFCSDCGASLFYRNQVALPGIVDIQSATLDDPGAAPAQAQIQIADRIPWMEQAHTLPAFERFPPQD